jgi:hypothetical protein
MQLNLVSNVLSEFGKAGKHLSAGQLFKYKFERLRGSFGKLRSDESLETFRNLRLDGKEDIDENLFKEKSKYFKVAGKSLVYSIAGIFFLIPDIINVSNEGNE